MRHLPVLVLILASTAATLAETINQLISLRDGPKLGYSAY